MERFEVTKYKNGCKVRLKNKRILCGGTNEKIVVSIQAILPESELSFDGNFINRNMKNTAFSLTIESAIALHTALQESLIILNPQSSNN